MDQNEHPEQADWVAGRFEVEEEAASAASSPTVIAEVPVDTPIPDITLTALYGACEFIANNCPSQDGADPEKLMEHFLGIAEEAAHRFLQGDEMVVMAQHNVPDVFVLEEVEGTTNDS